MFKKAKFPDGSRVWDPKEDKLWLIYDGVGHHLVCNDVYSLLFISSVPIYDVKNAKDIEQGDPLIFGTCLVREQAGDPIYLLAVHPARIRLHRISHPIIGEKYGFDYSLCRHVSLDLVKAIPRGRPLS